MASIRNRVFSQRLNQIMIERNIYPQEVQRLTGVHRQCVYEYLRGNKEPTLTSLVKLARGLKVSTDWLCGIK